MPPHGDVATAASSLEEATKLLHGGAWVAGLYPGAGEVGGTFRCAGRQAKKGGTPDPARALAEAQRRARTKVRRYCSANRLDRLVTLTFRGEGCHDPAQLVAEMRLFIARATKRGRDPFPWLWVPEWHPGGHGLHAHMAVGRWWAHDDLTATWGHGFTHIKRLAENRPGIMGAC